MINNNTQFGGFYSAAMFTASSHIQSAPNNQLQQLQGMMSSMMQNSFFQRPNCMPQLNQGFAQSPAANMPGFVPSPGMGMMTPTNPMSGQLAGGQFMGGGMSGGFMFGGFVQTGGMQTPKPTQGGITQSKDNPPEFTTPGGYKISSEGKDNAWKITTPEGKETRIWGDPHVKEGDGGKWDFKKQMSFVLPDGTKITAKTTPPRANGYTVTQGIDIMNGSQRASINDIDKNKPTSGGVKNDRWAVDAATKDGDYAVLGGDGDDWFLQGKNEIVGSEKQGEILKTKAGTTRGITGQAMEAMNEPGQGMAQMPQFGGQQFMMQMMNQIMTQLMNQMSQFMGGGMGGIR